MTSSPTSLCLWQEHFSEFWVRDEDLWYQAFLAFQSKVLCLMEPSEPLNMAFEGSLQLSEAKDNVVSRDQVSTS